MANPIKGKVIAPLSPTQTLRNISRNSRTDGKPTRNTNNTAVTSTIKMATQYKNIRPKKPPQRSTTSGRFASKRPESMNWGPSQPPIISAALALIPSKSKPAQDRQRVTQREPIRSSTPTDVEDDEDANLDNEDIDKQLVMWAGRLELESIDLREKSKGLIAELLQNSESLQTATHDLNGAIKALSSGNLRAADKGTPDLRKINTKLTEMHKSMNDSSNKSSAEQTESTKLLESINAELKELSRGLNDVNTLQVAFSEQLINLTRSQESMKKEFKSLMKRMTEDTVTSNNLLLTPDNSSMISRPAIYTKRYRSQQRTRMDRKIIKQAQQPQQPQHYGNESYICLLSDDMITEI